MKKQDRKRYYSKVDKHGPYPKGKCLDIWPELLGSRCWIWTAHCDVDGYGQFWYKRKQEQAHRRMYKLKHGKIPKGKHICHKCDNPSCVRDEHLFVGTPTTNIQDCVVKNRHVGHRKLRNQDVRKIRKLYATGNYYQRELAERFEVTDSAIIHILHRHTWKYV